MKPLSGRVIGVFGLPCSGKSTVIQAVLDSSKEILARISSGDIARRLSTEADAKFMADGGLFPHEEPLRKEILETIDKRRASGAEIVFLDGFPRTPQQVTWMADNQLAGHLAGCFIQVWCEPEQLLARAAYRMRDEQDKFEALKKKIAVQQTYLYTLDKTIAHYGFPYYMVVNDDPAHAVKQMAKFVGLKK